jgi:class 3 adenylate cyclase
VRSPPLILSVDDNAENLEILRLRLESKGFRVIEAGDGEEALARVKEALPDLVLLDVMMPKLDGIETVRRLKADASLPFIPVLLVTAKGDARDVVAGLDAGAEDYVVKPFDHAGLLARVRSMLRIKALHDELAELNRGLGEKVAAQVAELERMGSLKRFLPPQVAEMIVAEGSHHILDHHRREIVVLFCDLRGFTAFSETAEPEEVMALLADYHGVAGPLVRRFEGTLDRFAGDGMMVVFNDPLPCPDPAQRAARLSLEIREGVAGVAERWRRQGHRIGVGIGIAQGFATMGRVGFDDRWEYSAIGTVVNVAARLCAEALDGQILMTQKVATSLDGAAATEPVGELSLKGITRPVAAYNLVRL